MAIPAIKMAIEKDGKNAIYQYHLGLVYMKTGDLDLARGALESALRLNADFPG